MAQLDHVDLGPGTLGTNDMIIQGHKIIKSRNQNIFLIFNPIRPGLFSRSPGPRESSEAPIPKIKVNIKQLK